MYNFPTDAAPVSLESNPFILLLMGTDVAVTSRRESCPLRDDASLILVTRQFNKVHHVKQQNQKAVYHVS